jgi:uncharacterized membrane protein YgdD (TMEM256/DUF423 family)
MNSTFFHRLQSLAAITGVLGVIIGAFGAHFLKSRLDATNLETLKTGVLYLFIHTIATLLVCVMAQRQQTHDRWLRLSGIAFLAGIVMFSGSLFIIATKSLTGFPASAIGFITPLGGFCFILGWLFLLFQSRAR